MTDQRDDSQDKRVSGARRSTGSAAGRARNLFLLMWMPAAALLLVLSGVLLLAQGPGPTEISWVAYTPLPEEGLPDGVMLFSRGMRAGALLVLAGAVLFAFWGGLQAGNRRRPRGRRS
jgi:hypothetical protein